MTIVSWPWLATEIFTTEQTLQVHTLYVSTHEEDPYVTFAETENRQGTHWIRLGQDKDSKIIFKQFEFAQRTLWAIDIKNQVWYKEELEEDIMSEYSQLRYPLCRFAISYCSFLLQALQMNVLSYTSNLSVSSCLSFKYLPLSFKVDKIYFQRCLIVLLMFAGYKCKGKM